MAHSRTPRDRGRGGSWGGEGRALREWQPGGFPPQSPQVIAEQPLCFQPRARHSKGCTQAQDTGHNSSNDEPPATRVHTDESHRDEFGAKEADKLELIKHKLPVSGPQAGKILSSREGPMGGRVIKKSKGVSITNYCLRFVTSKREKGGC